MERRGRPKLATVERSKARPAPRACRGHVASVWRAPSCPMPALRVRPPFFDFAQEATQRGVGKHREPLGERAARHGARGSSVQPSVRRVVVARVGDPHVRLPASRSNVWPRSWKRFLIDFMYGRGLAMLYPNLRLQRSFSTTFMERGGHSAKDGREEAIQARDRREMQPRWQPRWQPRGSREAAGRRPGEICPKRP